MGQDRKTSRRETRAGVRRLGRERRVVPGGQQHILTASYDCRLHESGASLLWTVSTSFSADSPRLPVPARLDEADGRKAGYAPRRIRKLTAFENRPSTRRSTYQFLLHWTQSGLVFHWASGPRTGRSTLRQAGLSPPIPSADAPGDCRQLFGDSRRSIPWNGV